MRWQGAIAPEAVCERSQPASEACPSAAGTGSPECEALGITTNVFGKQCDDDDTGCKYWGLFLMVATLLCVGQCAAVNSCELLL